MERTKWLPVAMIGCFLIRDWIDSKDKKSGGAIAKLVIGVILILIVFFAFKLEMGHGRKERGNMSIEEVIRNLDARNSMRETRR